MVDYEKRFHFHLCMARATKRYMATNLMNRTSNDTVIHGGLEDSSGSTIR
jgi:hypothetical protein